MRDGGLIPPGSTMLRLFRPNADFVSGAKRLIRVAELLGLFWLCPDAALDFFEDHGRQCVLLVIHAQYKAQMAKIGKGVKKCVFYEL